MSEKSSFSEKRGCSVPLLAAPPQLENSVNCIWPKLAAQSTALGMQIPWLFQSPPTLIDFESLLKVFAPTERWLTMCDAVQSHDPRCRSASNVSIEELLNGAGNPTGPLEPGPSSLFERLNRYEIR